jgi:hypothetical protein
MQQSADNLRDHVGLNEDEVARLTKQNPSSLIFSSGYSQKGTIAL